MKGVESRWRRGGPRAIFTKGEAFYLGLPEMGLTRQQVGQAGKHYQAWLFPGRAAVWFHCKTRWLVQKEGKVGWENCI